MTDLPAPGAEADPSAQALADALPEIRSAKTRGWAFCALIVAVSAVLLILLSGVEGSFQWVIIILFMGGFGLVSIHAWVRKQHERAVMPVIARAFGLGYVKSPKDFYPTLPKNFIPQGGQRSVDDMMSGTVAGRSFRFAECKTETGGKNSSTLFQGLVLEVRASGSVPEFIIASEKETKGFLFFKGKVQVEGMELIRQSTGSDGQTYGLWSRPGGPRPMAGLDAFMDRIIALGPRVLGSATLYSLVSTGQYYYVSLRHKRDLYRIGGLFADETEVMSNVRMAARELGHPIELAAEILRAEEALLAAK
ncbi:hypothetical protein G5B31_15505 [Rhodobacter sp. SGA-6-6]|uniref:hypothetical protein n=1 Tax=Rhodobacter sp. SGA-6-6 TaxID=2710882 RepID=UPI0013EE16D9|nr:hypothetical protein [Rhodobacter sp. SGA-6-6]NGM46943.1 hypothetical protein [Rhodobacter sp. SGA-6-6]